MTKPVTLTTRTPPVTPMVQATPRPRMTPTQPTARMTPMKRTKGSTTTPEQKAWSEALNDAGVPAKVCKGFDEAREFVEAWV